MFFVMEIVMWNGDGNWGVVLNRKSDGWMKVMFEQLTIQEGGSGGWTWCVLKRRAQTLFSLSFDVLPYVKDVIPIDNNKKDVYTLDKLYRLCIGRIIFLICPRKHLLGFFRRWYKNMFNKKECLLKMNKWTKMGCRYV